MSSYKRFIAPLLQRWGKRILLWLILPFFTLITLSIAAIYLLCAYKNELITAVLEQQLVSNTGLVWQVQGPVTPKIFPYPGLSLHNVRILAVSPSHLQAAKGKPPLLSVGRLHLLLDFPSLLTGNISLHLVELESPDITLAYGNDGVPLWLPATEESFTDAQSPPQKDKAALPASSEKVREPDGERVNSTAESTPADNSIAFTETRPEEKKHVAPAVHLEEKISSATVAGDLHTPSAAVVHEETVKRSLAELNRFLAEEKYSFLPEVRIHNGSFTLLAPDGETDFSLKGIHITVTPQAPESFAKSSATFFLPAAGLETRLDSTFALETNPVSLKGKLNIAFSLRPQGQRAATGTLSTSLIWDGYTSVSLPDFQFTAEGDAMSASLALDIPSLSYAGTASLESFSLPRWFKFGRNLPPGLQERLHTINGTLDIKGNDSMVNGSNLNLHAGDLTVYGAISCPDFSSPEVVVDVYTDFANLDLVFPFLSTPSVDIPEPQEPVFTISHLIPFPDFAEDDGPDVGYDVRIRVEKPLVHDLSPGPLDIRVFPREDPITRVAFTEKDILGGSLEGWLDIDRGLVRMHYTLDSVGLAGLPENQGNSVLIDGTVSGNVTLDIIVDKDGHWADDWHMKMDAKASSFSVTGASWSVAAEEVQAQGEGPVHTVRKNGMSVSGLWDVRLSTIHSSWYPKGKDTIKGIFDGKLSWPPAQPRDSQIPRRNGVERVTGELNLDGSLIIPLGSERVPLKGKVESSMDWNLHNDTVQFKDAVFEGLGSKVSGAFTIDSSGKDVTVTAPVAFKLAPRTLLKAWNLLPSGIQMPLVLEGTSTVNSTGNTVLFQDLKALADGDPITGTITGSGGQQTPGAQSQKGSHWKFRLSSSKLLLDTFFPRATEAEKKLPPSTTLWNLSFLKALSIDAEIFLKEAKLHGAHFIDTKLVCALQRGRFSLQAQTARFYMGEATLLIQGTFIPERSQVNITRLLGEMKNFSLGKSLQDIANDSSYGGRTQLLFDLSGSMRSNAEVYSGLSGVWSMKIEDGLYPAFIGSETTGLRNTFSTASASGVMERGVIRSDNFLLSGLMVDMYGGGWVDLVQDTLNLEIYVTLAKVPTVPVRFYGDLSSPSMILRGAHMVVHTAQSAGGAVFGLLRGILELPGRAVNAISGNN